MSRLRVHFRAACSCLGGTACLFPHCSMDMDMEWKYSIDMGIQHGNGHAA
jgi:hypothetical protein